MANYSVFNAFYDFHNYIVVVAFSLSIFSLNVVVCESVRLCAADARLSALTLRGSVMALGSVVFNFTKSLLLLHRRLWRKQRLHSPLLQ